MTFARCPWYIAGPLVGLIIVGLRATLNRPLGAVGGWIELAGWMRGRRLGVRAFIAIGTILGGVLFSLASGSLRPSLSYGATALPFEPGSAAQLATLAVAGTLIGFGARMAGGCTSGHGLCGTSLGSPASFAATLTFFATAVVVAHALAAAFGGVQ